MPAPLNMQKPHGFAKSYSRFFKTAWRYATGYRHWFAASLLLGFSAQLAALVGPYAIGQMVNVLQTHGSAGVTLAGLWLLAFAAGNVLQTLLQMPANRLEGRFSFKISARLRTEIYRKLTALPVAWHQDHHSGDIINRVATAQGALRNFAYDYKQIVQLLTGFLGPVVVLTGLYPALGIGSLAAASVIIVFTIKMGIKGRLLRKAYNDLDNKFSARRADYLGNIRTIITLRLQDQTARDLEKRLDELEAADTRDTNWQNWRWLSEGLLIDALTVACIAYMLWRLADTANGLRVGDLVIIVSYLRQMSSSFGGFGFFYSSLSRRLTDYEGIRYIEDAPLPDVTDIDVHRAANWAQLAIRDLSFSYKPDAASQLNGLSLTLMRGRKIALVGASGAGKSTLLAVLRGLYPASQGAVAVDDHMPAQPLAILAGLSTLIPQEPEIFENTIRFNVTLGVDHPDEDVLEACHLACFDTVLVHLPNGLDSDIREKGVNLSGGQKQRLALARGIFAIRTSSLVLFDEPTSSVDSITERRIYQNLLAAFPDICLISSIHRLHMLPLFDDVIVMEAGQIVQQGPVAVLSGEPGLLHDLLAAYHDGAANDPDDLF